MCYEWKVIQSKFKVHLNHLKKKNIFNFSRIKILNGMVVLELDPDGTILRFDDPKIVKQSQSY